MPKVPTYDNFTVSPAVNPDVHVAAPEFQNFAAQQGAAMGKAELAAGSAISRIAADMQAEANKVRVDDARNKLDEFEQALKYAPPDPRTNDDGGFTALKGERALERPGGKPLPDEYRDKLDKKASELSEALGNDAQRQLFGMYAKGLSTRFYGQAQAHMTGEFRDYTLSVQSGKIKNAANAIVLDPFNEETVKTSLADINNGVYTTGRIKGMSGKEIGAVQAEAVSATQLSVVKSLLNLENIDGATAYYEKYKDQFSGIQKAEAQNLLNKADNSKAAISAADEIWSQMGPRGYNAPVDLYKMEQAAKEKFSDSPTKYKATVEELRSRKSAFDASQSEFVSSNADAVGKLVVAGKTLAQIQASPAFNALPGKEQAQIYEHLTIKDEQTKARNNFANYLDYSDPTKLASMTRQQVSALWPTIGMEHTQTLVNKWDQLQNKEYLLTAKMDNEQFNAIAQQFGMDPFDKNKTTQDKADLGLLHDRVNGMLEQAAKAQRRPLTREEKEGIMRDAMARKVTLKGWFASETGTGIFSEEKPIVRLTDEEQKNVFVPLDARKQILSEMQKRYKATAGTKEQAAFEPTEDNIRMWYLTTMRNK